MKTEILGVKAPVKECTDGKCPFHGNINVKEELFKGVIVKKDIHHSAVLEWFRWCYVPKYERYEIKRSRIRVHNPPCLDAQVGQIVLAAKTRPLSKTKNHVIIQVLGEKKILPPAEEEKENKKLENEKLSPQQEAGRTEI